MDELTYESDRLPAFSGLAHEFQAITADDYHADLWEKDLSFGSLWRSAFESVPGKYTGIW
jgi:hypothetical protein